ncbi:DUF948 domain-containing protein [Bacillus marinisedimentorum]|uniref:DUF948 domain-containing protein n=1 Tax=Bacillus marinisedimentorum TaxID=1821260 RepID=UPI0007E24031|nr:DUF948 domain-containing protein [Bacillus marinisedimentorum]
MEWIGYLAALIAALAFAGLVVYLVKVLKQAEKTLENVAEVTEGLDQQINGITTEATVLLHKTNKLADGIEEQAQRLTPVAESIEKVGDALETVNHSIEEVSETVSNKTTSNKRTIAKALEWGSAGMSMYKRYKDEFGKNKQRNLPKVYQPINE